MSILGKIKGFIRQTESNSNAIEDDVVVSVEHVTMEFKITKDKIDTLKEYVIRTLKRNKKEKEKVRVLDDITFKVHKGDKLGILGFNGAGKSTLLKILAGIYEPTSGNIQIKGKVAPLLELGAGFDKNYTGRNNIYLNGAFLSMNKDFLDKKFNEIVEFSELGEYIEYPVKNYSSGMRAKLGFSIATLVEPDILIVDEILSVGDIKFRKKSSQKIDEMMADGVTVLLVSHSIGQIRKICDKCIWIDNGKLIMQGDADEVCDAYVANAEGKNWGFNMDKRWYGIILILLAGLACMYLIADNSFNIGHAVMVVDDISVTLPNNFLILSNDQTTLSLQNRHNTESILVKYLSDGNNSQKEYDNHLKAKSEDLKITKHVSNETAKTIYYKNTTSGKEFLMSYVDAYDRTLLIKMENYNDTNQQNADLMFIIKGLQPDLKQDRS